jgi:Ca2+-binding RTX toxin-like protein
LLDGFSSLGNDKLYGEAGDDVIYGDYQTASDLLFEEPENTSAGGNDYLDGGDGADQLFGRGRRDNLVGGAGNDQLQGDAGNDRVSGGAGDDVIIAGRGDDRLFGDEGAPAGSDTFRFLANSGKDVIQDFQNDIDTIEISSSYGLMDGGDVVATATISGSNVILHLDANTTITLYNYTLPPSTLEDDIAII